jgi:branched-chain amino acid transport system substrate-binding protein
MNDQTRTWSRRYQAHYEKKEMPNHMQAGVYSGTMDYLEAVDKVGSPADGRAVVAAMKAAPVDDPLFGHVSIREDGRAVHPMYLLQVKTPEESTGAWDVFKVTETIPPEQAFRPLHDGGCPLVETTR